MVCVFLQAKAKKVILYVCYLRSRLKLNFPLDSLSLDFSIRFLYFSLFKRDLKSRGKNEVSSTMAVRMTVYVA